MTIYQSLKNPMRKDLFQFIVLNTLTKFFANDKQLEEIVGMMCDMLFENNDTSVIFPFVYAFICTEILISKKLSTKPKNITVPLRSDSEIQIIRVRQRTSRNYIINQKNKESKENKEVKINKQSQKDLQRQSRHREQKLNSIVQLQGQMTQNFHLLYSIQIISLFENISKFILHRYKQEFELLFRNLLVNCKYLKTASNEIKGQIDNVILQVTMEGGMNTDDETLQTLLENLRQQIFIIRETSGSISQLLKRHDFKRFVQLTGLFASDLESTLQYLTEITTIQESLFI